MVLSHVRWLATADPAMDGTLDFAARELARYIRRLSGSDCGVQRARSFGQVADTAWLGLCGRLPQPRDAALTPALWDDGYAVWKADGGLFIAGRNARSVLFGVYDLLERQGVRFIRPGPDGEIIPRLSSILLPEKPIVEQAYYRHRGVCIEGAPSLDHALGMVDWCAKKRMNTLFLQFFSSRYFYNNWYARPYNPPFADHEVSDAEAIAMDNEVIAALKTRGMVFHHVGHGWTATAIGMPRSGWVKAGEAVAADRVRWLAEIKGERKLFHDIPINTELCYSFRPAFDALVEAVVRYVEAHPETDVVHVWLSDATNNKCECPECRKLTISDWYAKIINALSEALHRRAPGKRFVFLCYKELLWPPEQVAIDERYGNAIMMFAPITRSYGRSLADPTTDDGKAYPRPPLNECVDPRTNAFFAKTLADWRRAFHGDSFDFDYHLMWAVWSHLTDTVVARIYHEDLQHLKRIGVDGIISCQSFRAFYPSGLAMTVLAEALWNPRVAWPEMRRGYLEAAFGESAGFVDGYLAQLESLLDTGDADWRVPPLSNADAAKLARVYDLLKAALEELRSRRASASNPTHRRSLDILAHHARFLQIIVKAYQANLARKPDEARAALDRAADYLRRTEPRYHRFMDTQLLLRMK